MRRLILFVSLLAAVPLISTATVAADHDLSWTQVNLRSCVDGGNGACFFGTGDIPVDGVTMCLVRGSLTRCATTADGGEDYGFDSEPPGSYWVFVDSVTEGYELEELTVTTASGTPYKYNSAPGHGVHFVLKGDDYAVYVNALLRPVE